MIVHVPTTYGDVRLSKRTDETTLLETHDLTYAETAVVRKLLKKYKAEGGDDEASKLRGRTFSIPKPLAKVHKQFVKLLKPGKETVTAVKLKDGRLEEVSDISQVEEMAKDGKLAKEGAAATVEKPKRGPHARLLDKREIIASEVLRKFLNDDQIEDFDERGCFVAKGCDSGNRYLIRHRHSKYRARGDIGSWYVADLDRRLGVCNYPTGLPPSEETLALLIMISCREQEWVGDIMLHEFADHDDIMLHPFHGRS